MYGPIEEFFNMLIHNWSTIVSLATIIGLAYYSWNRDVKKTAIALTVVVASIMVGAVS